MTMTRIGAAEAQGLVWALARLRPWLGLALGAVLLVSCGEAREQAAGQHSLADIRAQVRAYERTWNTHDAGQVAVFYSPDADMIMGSGPRIVGRAAIEAWWARYFAAISDRRTGTFQVESVRLLAPEVALVDIGSLTAGPDENDEELPARRARGTWVLTAQGGQWLIASLRGLPAEGETRSEPGTDR